MEQPSLVKARVLQAFVFAERRRVIMTVGVVLIAATLAACGSPVNTVDAEPGNTATPQSVAELVDANLEPAPPLSSLPPTEPLVVEPGDTDSETLDSETQIVGLEPGNTDTGSASTPDSETPAPVGTESGSTDPDSAPSATSPAKQAIGVDYGGYRPHFQGHGTTTPGGRGGKVIKVTNLNDSGAGSFRAAVSTAGKRIVVFEVSGNIVLDSELTINDSFLTVAGQTAPSPGITINAKCGMRLELEDAVFQHLRIRRGDESLCGSLDTVWVRNNAARIVFDHVSLSWGVDGTLDFNAATGPEPTDISVLDSVISETLRCSIYSEVDTTRSCHSRAMLVADNPASGSLTLARNVFAHNAGRNPAVSGGWNVANINNLVYNYAPDTSRHGAITYINGPTNEFRSTFPNRVAQIGVVAIPGKDTAADTLTIRIQNLYPGSEVYLHDNKAPGMTSASGDGQWSGVNDSGNKSNQSDFRVDRAPSFFASLNMEVMASSEVQGSLLDKSGARPNDRDPIDRRVISDVKNRTGGQIDRLSEVGGLPNLQQNTRTLSVPANANAVADDKGRTVIEHWLEDFARELED